MDYFLFTDPALLGESGSGPGACFAAGILVVTGMGGPENQDLGVLLLENTSSSVKSSQELLSGKHGAGVKQGP